MLGHVRKIDFECAEGDSSKNNKFKLAGYVLEFYESELHGYKAWDLLRRRWNIYPFCADLDVSCVRLNLLIDILNSSVVRTRSQLEQIIFNPHLPDFPTHRTQFSNAGENVAASGFAPDSQVPFV